MIASVLLAASTASANPNNAFYEVDGSWHRSEHGCGTVQRPPVVNPGARLAPPPAVGLRTVFLNKNGGTYTSGNTNSATNKANVFMGSASTAVIPPLDTAAFNWQVISDCVKMHFAKFNVRVVETEPTSGTYVEAVVGGTGTEIGFGANQLFGIASTENFCGVDEQGIAFSFSETHRGVGRRNEELCATIAHEVGHVLALEHETLPTDLMSYVLITDSQTKAFVDQNSGCGTTPQDTMANCSCGGTSTSSSGRLKQFIGLRDSETVAPTLTVQSPSDDDTVGPVFDVVVDATDNAEMSDVTATIDGEEVGVDTEPEGTIYTIRTTAIEVGEHTLSVIAHDAAGNMASKDLSITVKKLATGDSCSVNEACNGGICAMDSDGGFCSEACGEAASGASCPDDFDCEAVGNTSICVPSSGGGCGCSSSSPGPFGLMALVLGAIVLRRRRRS
ncbi:MAG: Ig-like domain-containing protein [Kofleriaceae bacterium]